jgi:hypothetical protein
MNKLLSKIDTKLCDLLGIDFYSALIVGICMVVGNAVLFYGTYCLILKYIHASRGY